MNNFKLGVVEENNQRVVNFTNNTANFVEVVVEIDGKLVKGYCYPPFHHKPIRRLRSGEKLPFSNAGCIRAYVYAGIGHYKDELGSDVPPFIQRKLNHQENFNTDQILQERLKRKVTFRRTSLRPVEVLEIPY